MQAKTHKDKVIEECQRIETLARTIADAANRRFMAPIDEEDFETVDGPMYMADLRRLRTCMIERARGIDPELDERMEELCPSKKKT